MDIMKRSVMFGFVAFLVTGLLLSMTATGQASEAKKIPRMMTITTLRIGGAGHTMAISLGEVLKKEVGIKTRVVPISSSKARLNYLRSRSAQFAILDGQGTNDAQWGAADYATYDWGPQPVQMAWFGPSYLGIMTTKAHKDINTIADIRGKRVAAIAMTAPMRLAQSFLAFAGLTWKDVKKVPVPGYIAQFKALLAKQVDVVPVANPMTSMLYEIQASPGGLKWLPLPHNNKEAWKRLRSIAPAGMPALLTVGPELSKEKPLEGFVHAYTIFSYADQDPDLVYTLAKTIGENLEKLHAMAGAWKVYTTEFALGIEGFPHSYHPGAVKYFKEKGLWTEKHEKWNTKQVALQKELNNAWEPFLDKATQEKWKTPKLKKAWHVKIKEITGYDIPLIKVK